MPSTPSLAELLRRVLDSRQMDIHVALPGRVERYDAASQTADVLPMVRRAIQRAEDPAEDDLEELPVLPNVPVCWPRAGGYCLTMPLAAGDSVLLVFCERSIDTWRTVGDSSGPQDPRDARMHDLSGAVAIPGIEPASRALASASADHLVLGRDGGADPATVHVRQSEVRLGTDAASDFVALATAVDANFQAIVNLFASWTPVPHDGGAALKTLASALSFAATAATKVKAV